MKKSQLKDFDPYGNVINLLKPQKISLRLRILFFIGMFMCIVFFVLWNAVSDSLELRYLSAVMQLIFLTTIAFTILTYSKFKFYIFKQKFDSVFMNISFFHRTLGGKDPYRHYRIAELDYYGQVYMNRKYRNLLSELLIAVFLLLVYFEVIIIDFGNPEVVNNAISIISSTLNGYLVADILEGLIIKYEVQEKKKAEFLDTIGPFY